MINNFNDALTWLDDDKNKKTFMEYIAKDNDKVQSSLYELSLTAHFNPDHYSHELKRLVTRYLEECYTSSTEQAQECVIRLVQEAMGKHNEQ